MIRVAPAAEPPSFDAQVRRRGSAAIQRLLGRPAGRGRKPTQTYQRPEDIPADRFPAYWREPRPTDERSALDDLMDRYRQRCAYLAMHIARATGSPTVDHFVPKSADWRLVYEWTNYRLAAHCVNAKKGVLDVVDPFVVRDGWFALDLATLEVVRGPKAPKKQHARIERTRALLNLRPRVAQRAEYIGLYRERIIPLAHLEARAPFIASELRRQGALAPGDA